MVNERETGNRFAIRPHRQIGHGLRQPARSSPTATVQQLLDLAEQLRQVLVPVEADANYRRRLKGELILAAQQRSEAKPLPRRRRLLFIGAAAVGSLASVAGVIIAFVVRYRHGRTSHIAAG
ncbi:MAG: hypothetical protein JXM73_07560 [Anaerolineae bacterium]|nr:hypothetical protein [Anaerolineae bacterium]